MPSVNYQPAILSQAAFGLDLRYGVTLFKTRLNTCEYQICDLCGEPDEFGMAPVVVQRESLFNALDKLRDIGGEFDEEPSYILEALWKDATALVCIARSFKA